MQVYDMFALHHSIALKLFASRQLTMSQAAKLADIPLEAFIALLRKTDIDAVDYPVDELEKELKHAL